MFYDHFSARSLTWLNWVDEDDDEHDEVGLKENTNLRAIQVSLNSTLRFNYVLI